MNIRLHIERLILDGLPVTRAQGPRVKAALEAELTRMLVEGGGLSQELQRGVIPQVRAGNLPFTAESSPAQLGKQIAQSVYGGIGRAK
jgi:hypothetical protein